MDKHGGVNVRLPRKRWNFAENFLVLLESCADDLGAVGFVQLINLFLPDIWRIADNRVDLGKCLQNFAIRVPWRGLVRRKLILRACVYFEEVFLENTREIPHLGYILPIQVDGREFCRKRSDVYTPQLREKMLM